MLTESVGAERPLKVSELVSLLKRNIEEQHRFVRVVGEISSWKEWRSGHCYFDLKDEQALIPAVMFKPHFARVPFKVTDGLSVIISGRLSVYAQTSRLQLVAEAMEPLGAGALALAFEQLKNKLLSEGLFEARHKKTIKPFITTIGIVTSSHGAALRDMVRIIKTRFPHASILCAFARVQGVGAKEEIVEALKRLDTSGLCDVIIVGRGGGSLEDLWAFNEEMVARAIFEAKTPVISAVGHETDTTISDMVADLRAATPTHAAQLVTPLLSDLHNELERSLHGLMSLQRNKISLHKLRLLEQQKYLKDPKLFLYRYWQMLDEQSQRLSMLAPHRLLSLRKNHLHDLKQQLELKSPKKRLVIAKEQLITLAERLPEKLAWQVKQKRYRFTEAIAKLEALSPLKVLARGFSVIEDRSNKKCLTHVQQTFINQTISIRFHDGIAHARITEE